MRTAIGVIACLLYIWRVYDPKGSYAAFYDVANGLTGWLVAGDGVMAALRNVISLILLDQAEGFLLGIVFLSLIQAPVWAVRRGAGWCWRRLRRRSLPRPEAADTPRTLAEPAPEPELLLTDPAPPAPPDRPVR